MNENMKNVIENVKMNICEHIFFSGDYNTELYKYAAEKIGYNTNMTCNYLNNKNIPTQIRKLPIISVKYNKQEKPTFDGSPMLTIMLAAISLCVVFFHYYLFSLQPTFFNEASR